MHIGLIPLFAASNGLAGALQRTTPEGQLTVGILLAVSLFSWAIIIAKLRQLHRARIATKKFLTAFRTYRDPMKLYRIWDEFPGSPAYEAYYAGTRELDQRLQHQPVEVLGRKQISKTSFDSVRSAIERTAGAQTLQLEKGMILLLAAVVGGPFVGLLGTVWGAVVTFSGIANGGEATFTSMAPSVAGALIAAVVGLLLALPAMFTYLFVTTSIRGMSQDLDLFVSELSSMLEHGYVDQRSLSDEVADALRARTKDELAGVVRPAKANDGVESVRSRNVRELVDTLNARHLYALMDVLRAQNLPATANRSEQIALMR